LNRGYLYLAITILIFGPFEVISKFVHGIDAIQLNFLRFLIGGMALLPFAVNEIRKGNRKIKIGDIVHLVGLSVLYIPVSMVFLQVAIQNTSASLSTFVFSANPIFIAVFAAWILHERPTTFIVAAIALELVGLLFIANPSNARFDFYFFHLCFAAVVFAFYNVLMRKATGRLGNLVAFTLVVIFGTAVLGAGMLVAGIPWFQGLSMRNALPLLYLGVFGSGITFVCYYKGMELTSTNVGSIVFFLKPILGTIYAVIILNERLSLEFIIGAMLILAGSTVMIYGKERHRSAVLK
jgi:drug/metabolite transporter (DMT)-like permease